MQRERVIRFVMPLTMFAYRTTMDIQSFYCFLRKTQYTPRVQLQSYFIRMLNLNDQKKIIEALGGQTVITSVESFPNQLSQSLADGYAVTFPQEYSSVSSVLVCGMGGSRFPSLIIQHLCKEELRVPLVINDTYSIPGYVNATTLVILSSYSGTTEEVLYAAEQAQKQGARIAIISSGGKLEQLAKENSYPAYIFNPIHNPSKQPRIGFGYSVGSQLGMLIKLGLVSFTIEDIQKAITELELLDNPFAINVESDSNPAKQIAQTIYNKYPYFVVSEFLTGIGNAIQNQTNETAKSISSFRVIPELNHHMMEGLKFPVDLNEMAIFVLFYSHLYSPRVQKRFNVTKEIIEQNKIQAVWHTLKGKTKLSQAFEMMSFGTYVTMYLAALYEQDPNAIPFVDYFKKRLNEMAG